MSQSYDIGASSHTIEIKIMGVCMNPTAQISNRPAPCLQGCWTFELADTLNVGRALVRREFDSAIIQKGNRNRPNLFSREGVRNHLCEMNGRWLPYPTAPLLTSPQAYSLMVNNGYSRKYSSYLWNLCRAPNKVPPFLWVGSARRFYHHEVIDWCHDHA